MKLCVQRTTSEHEVLSVEVDVKDPTEFSRQVAIACKAADARALEMNQRVVTAHTEMRKLPGEVQAIVHGIFEILYGRAAPESAAMIASARTVLEEKLHGRAESDARGDGRDREPPSGAPAA